MLRNSLTQDYNLSISKGGENYGFYAAARYRKLGLYNKYDSDDRLSLYLKNDLQVTKWFSLTLGADISVNRASYSQASYLGETDAMAYDTLFNPDGSLAYRYPYNQLLAETGGETQGLQSMGYNAIEEAQNNMYKTENLYMKYFIQTGFDITKDLNFEVKFQYEKRKLDGKESISDFKGKLTIIDFLSTGCIPCKAEVPYFEKLAKEMEGKDVQFLSVSLDTGDELMAEWEKVMKAKPADSRVLGLNLPGGFNSDFLPKLLIKSVPRIMLLDKEGKIIDAYAKRPSDPKLKQQIEALL